jgi:uncharacterized protein (TIGR00369 family)
VPDADRFTPRDPDFERRVRENFARQSFMHTLGATLRSVAPGEVAIELVPRAELTQQHGYVHAGVVTSIVDNACGYAALSLMPAGSEVLAVEFKVNLLAPAVGSLLVARARVVRSGRTLTVCQGDVFAHTADGERHVAMMQATIIRMDAASARPEAAGE